MSSYANWQGLATVAPTELAKCCGFQSRVDIRSESLGWREMTPQESLIHPPSSCFCSCHLWQWDSQMCQGLSVLLALLASDSLLKASTLLGRDIVTWFVVVCFCTVSCYLDDFSVVFLCCGSYCNRTQVESRTVNSILFLESGFIRGECISSDVL